MNQFSELNIEHLKRMALRWVNQYERRGVAFESISLCRYVSDYLKERNSLKYAIIFSIPHYQPKDEFLNAEINAETDIEMVSKNIMFDPYLFFILETGYFHRKDKGLPDAFKYNDFGIVYDPYLRKDFEKDWLLVPAFKGLSLPSQILWNEDRVVLYKGLKEDITPEKDPEWQSALREDLLREHRERIKEGKTSPLDVEPYEPIIISPERNEGAEQAIWDEKVQPIVDRCYCGEFQFESFPDVKDISQENLNSMHGEILSFCNRVIDPGLLFTTMMFDGGDKKRNIIDVFEILILKKLRAGRAIVFEDRNQKQISLEDAFYDFLEKLFNERTLPFFLTQLLPLCGFKGNCHQGGIRPECDSDQDVEGLSEEDQLDKILIEIDGDIQIFYESLKFVMKKHGGLLYASLTYAQEAFELVQNDVRILIKEDIEHKSYGSDQYSRDIQGAILQKMVKRLQPSLEFDCKIVRNVQGLYRRLVGIRKTRL
jgi:hypothetical protein